MAVWSVAVSSDGKRLVTGSRDKMAKVWDAMTGRELLTLKGHDLSVTALAFFPDGRRFITGSDDRTVKIWDSTTGRTVLTLTDVGQRPFVAVSSDGNMVVAGSYDTVKVWVSSRKSDKLQ